MDFKKLRLAWGVLLWSGWVNGLGWTQNLGSGNWWARPILPGSVRLSATAAFLADQETGAELYSKNPDLKVFPASTTKIMTALLVAEYGHFQEEVKISAKAAKVGEASIWLEEGEKIQLEDLLAAALMKSANDACIAIAEHVAGSEAVFVAQMNERARELGATQTHFVNPHGLHDPDHYTTARDLVIIARAALQQPIIRYYCSLREKQLPWPGHPWPRTIRNLNQLLWRNPEVDGIKTGSTRQAGHCLLFSATHEGWQLIGVVLQAPHRWEDSQTLLDWGFSNFEQRCVIPQGMFLGSIPVPEGTPHQVRALADRNVTVILPRGQPNPPFEYLLPEKLEAPIAAQAPLGQVLVRGYHCSGRAFLLAERTVKKAWWPHLCDRVRSYLSTPGLPAGLLLGLVLYGTFAKNYRRRRFILATPRRRLDPRRPRLR